MSNVIGALLVCFPFALVASMRCTVKGEPAWAVFAGAFLFLAIGALPPVLGIGLLAGWI